MTLRIVPSFENNLNNTTVGVSSKNPPIGFGKTNNLREIALSASEQRIEPMSKDKTLELFKLARETTVNDYLPETVPGGCIGDTALHLLTRAVLARRIRPEMLIHILKGRNSKGKFKNLKEQLQKDNYNGMRPVDLLIMVPKEVAQTVYQKGEKPDKGNPDNGSRPVNYMNFGDYDFIGFARNFARLSAVPTSNILPPTRQESRLLRLAS